MRMRVDIMDWVWLCCAMSGWSGNWIAIGMVWLIGTAYLRLAFTHNKRTDNAGFGALVFDGFCWRLWEATGFGFRFDLPGEVFYSVL